MTHACAAADRRFPAAGSPVLRGAARRACAIESLGFDALWIVDHMWARGLPDVDFLEGWSSIAALAEATSRLRLGVLVTCNSYRNPGMLAKTVATADHISAGRIELGLGAGWMEEEYRAYGFDFPPISTRLKQLEEALGIITGLFTKHRTSLDGSHYRFVNAPFEPKPGPAPASDHARRIGHARLHAYGRSLCVALELPDAGCTAASRAPRRARAPL